MDLYCWGRQAEFQCGREEKDIQSWPKKMDSKIKWTQVACSLNRTLALSSDGELYTWGIGLTGELGLGFQNTANSITKIEKAPRGVKWKQIACSYESSFALTEIGELYTWGANESGQLAQGHTKMIDRPTRVPFEIPLTFLAVGANHCVALNEFGECFTWGANNAGQLGHEVKPNPNYTYHGSPLQFSAVPMKLPSDRGYKSVAAGFHNSAAITNRGELFTWGSGINGRLGHGNTENVFSPKQVIASKDVQFSQVSLGRSHTLALTDTHNMYGWGTAIHGELGYGGRRRQLVPRRIETPLKFQHVIAGNEISYALDGDGGLYSWGSATGGLLGNGRQVGHTLIPTKLQTSIKFKSISVGNSHIFGVGDGLHSSPLGWTQQDEMIDPYVNTHPPLLLVDDDVNIESYVHPMIFPPPEVLKMLQSGKEQLSSGEQQPKQKQEDEEDA